MQLMMATLKVLKVVGGRLTFSLYVKCFNFNCNFYAQKKHPKLFIWRVKEVTLSLFPGKIIKRKGKLTVYQKSILKQISAFKFGDYWSQWYTEGDYS